MGRGERPLPAGTSAWLALVSIAPGRLAVTFALAGLVALLA